MKGQYFSFDAIVASVIFMLAMSLLLGQWYSARQSTDLSGDYLLDDAFRMSSILVGRGAPDGWYTTLPSMGPIMRLGLGVQIGGGVRLNNTILDYLNPSSRWADSWGQPTAYYNATRTLLGASSNVAGAVCPTQRGGSIPCWYFGYTNSLGLNGSMATDIARVRRIVVVNDPSTGEPIPATLDLFLYRNTTS